MSNQETIRGIAFDLEGPVVNVEDIHHRAHYLSAGDAGVNLDFDTALERLPHFIGGPDIEIAREIYLLSNKKLCPEEIERLKQLYYEELLRTIKIQPRDGFVEFLEAIKKLGFPTAIGSSTPNQRAVVLLQRSGVASLFDEKMIVLKSDVPKEKPSPDVYLETAKRMSISTQNQVIFEDSKRGVAAGILAGSIAIGMVVFDRIEIIKELKEAGAKLIYKNWEEVDIDSLLKLL